MIGKIMKVVLLLTMTAVFPACGSSENAPNDAGSAGIIQDQQVSEPLPPENAEPVTLEVQLTGPLEQVFKTYLEPVLKQKLAHLTLEYKQGKWDEMIAAGDIPDIVMPNGSLTKLIELGLNYDMSNLIKTNHFDLGKIDRTLI